MASKFDTASTALSSLRQSTWTTPAVLAGLCVLLIWRSTSLLQRDWLAAVPLWLLLTITVIIPQVFFLIFPLVTRRQPQPYRLHLPKLKRLLIEAAIAIPITFGCLLLTSVLQLAVTQLLPGRSIVPEVYDRMAKSTGTPFIYGFLLLSFLYAPIAEEIFFRGFLFNAFRRRMPLVVATLLQSVIFGFAHFFGSLHAIAAALLGLVLALVYYWRQTIFTPIFVHIGYNGVAAAAVFLAMHANANAPVLGVMRQEFATECVIGAVVPNSPAESAGLFPGDTITKLDNYAITDFQSLIDTVSHYRAGDSVVVTLTRNDETLQVQVVLAPRSSLPRP